MSLSKVSPLKLKFVIADFYRAIQCKHSASFSSQNTNKMLDCFLLQAAPQELVSLVLGLQCPLRKALGTEWLAQRKPGLFAPHFSFLIPGANGVIMWVCLLMAVVSSVRHQLFC